MDEQILIKEYLHDGKRLLIDKYLFNCDIKDSDIVAGGLITYDLPFECPGCKGKYVFLFKEGLKWIAFCGERPCMKSQSISSKMKDTRSF